MSTQRRRIAEEHELGRRRFIQGVGALAGISALGVSGVIGSSPATAAPARKSRASGRRVAVFGGGAGGLTTAHELIKRGFEVDLYERHDVLGGRARSWSVPNTGTGGREDLSAEFGPHVLLGAYQNLGETLLQIPTPRGTVMDNCLGVLTADIPPGVIGWYGSVLHIPFPGAKQFDVMKLPSEIIDIVPKIFPSVSPTDMPLFASKIVGMLTSGRKRQFDQFERMDIMNYFGQPGFAIKQLLRSLQTLNPSRDPDAPSVRGFNAMLQNCVTDMFTRGPGPGFRDVAYFLDGGMNEEWFDPWAAHLRSQGVTFHMSHLVTGLRYDGGRIVGATVRTPAGVEASVEADWYVVATTSDKAAALMNPAIVSADPALGRLSALAPSWLGAMQVYLTRKQKFGDAGPLTAPWLIVAIDDAAVWTNYQSRYGDGRVTQQLAVDIGAWETLGILHGKSANWCTNRERFEEVRAQMRRDLGDPTFMRDEDIHSIVYNPSISEPSSGPSIHDESGIGQDVGNWAWTIHGGNAVRGVGMTKSAPAQG